VQNNHNQQQLIAPSRQLAVQTTFAYLHWCGANPRKLPALPRSRGPPKQGHFSAILAGFYCSLPAVAWRILEDHHDHKAAWQILSL